MSEERKRFESAVARENRLQNWIVLLRRENEKRKIVIEGLKHAAVIHGGNIQALEAMVEEQTEAIFEEQAKVKVLQARIERKNLLIPALDVRIKDLKAEVKELKTKSE